MFVYLMELQLEVVCGHLEDLVLSSSPVTFTLLMANL